MIVFNVRAGLFKTPKENGASLMLERSGAKLTLTVYPSKSAKGTEFPIDSRRLFDRLTRATIACNKRMADTKTTVKHSKRWKSVHQVAER